VVTNNAVIDNSDGPDGPVHLSSPPMTGSLTLFQQEGMNPLGRRLLSLPGGIHFRNVALTLNCREDRPLAAALVAKCSHTLEFLHITCELLGTSVRHRVRTKGLLLFLAEERSASIDLSKAVRLESVYLGVSSESVDWISMALQTITPEHKDLRTSLDLRAFLHGPRQ